MIAVGAAKGLDGLTRWPRRRFPEAAERGPAPEGVSYRALAADYEPTIPGFAASRKDALMDRVFKSCQRPRRARRTGVFAENGAGLFPIDEAGAPRVRCRRRCLAHHVLLQPEDAGEAQGVADRRLTTRGPLGALLSRCRPRHERFGNSEVLDARESVARERKQGALAGAELTSDHLHVAVGIPRNDLSCSRTNAALVSVAAVPVWSSVVTPAEEIDDRQAPSCLGDRRERAIGVEARRTPRFERLLHGVAVRGAPYRQPVARRHQQELAVGAEACRPRLAGPVEHGDAPAGRRIPEPETTLRDLPDEARPVRS